MSLAHSHNITIISPSRHSSPARASLHVAVWTDKRKKHKMLGVSATWVDITTGKARMRSLPLLLRKMDEGHTAAQIAAVMESGFNDFYDVDIIAMALSCGSDTTTGAVNVAFTLGFDENQGCDLHIGGRIMAYAIGVSENTKSSKKVGNTKSSKKVRAAPGCAEKTTFVVTPGGCGDHGCLASFCDHGDCGAKCVAGCTHGGFNAETEPPTVLLQKVRNLVGAFLRNGDRIELGRQIANAHNYKFLTPALDDNIRVLSMQRMALSALINYKWTYELQFDDGGEFLQDLFLTEEDWRYLCETESLLFKLTCWCEKVQNNNGWIAGYSLIFMVGLHESLCGSYGVFRHRRGCRRNTGIDNVPREWLSPLQFQNRQVLHAIKRAVAQINGRFNPKCITTMQLIAAGFDPRTKDSFANADFTRDAHRLWGQHATEQLRQRQADECLKMVKAQHAATYPNSEAHAATAASQQQSRRTPDLDQWAPPSAAAAAAAAVVVDPSSPGAAVAEYVNYRKHDFFPELGAHFNLDASPDRPWHELLAELQSVNIGDFVMSPFFKANWPNVQKCILRTCALKHSIAMQEGAFSAVTKQMGPHRGRSGAHGSEHEFLIRAAQEYMDTVAKDKHRRTEAQIAMILDDNNDNQPDVDDGDVDDGVMLQQWRGVGADASSGEDTTVSINDCSSDSMGGTGGDSMGGMGGGGGGGGGGKEVCRDFQRGRCFRGESCRFAHVEEDGDGGRGPKPELSFRPGDGMGSDGMGSDGMGGDGVGGDGMGSVSASLSRATSSASGSASVSRQISSASSSSLDLSPRTTRLFRAIDTGEGAAPFLKNWRERGIVDDGLGNADPGGGWVCRSCYFTNGDLVNECEQCEGKRSAATAAAPATTASRRKQKKKKKKKKRKRASSSSRAKRASASASSTLARSASAPPTSSSVSARPKQPWWRPSSSGVGQRKRALRAPSSAGAPSSSGSARAKRARRAPSASAGAKRPSARASGSARAKRLSASARAKRRSASKRAAGGHKITAQRSAQKTLGPTTARQTSRRKLAMPGQPTISWPVVTSATAASTRPTDASARAATAARAAARVARPGRTCCLVDSHGNPACSNGHLQGGQHGCIVCGRFVHNLCHQMYAEQDGFKFGQFYCQGTKCHHIVSV